MRLGYMVPIPFLTSINGIAVVEEQRTAEQSVVGGFAGIPICMTVWTIEYNVGGARGRCAASRQSGGGIHCYFDPSD